MFIPPRCPNRLCENHRRPVARFFRRRGSYQPKCRPRPVPRFQCKHCGLGFSRQTFRMDYRDHKPHLNQSLFLSIASGLGIRQSCRNLHLSLRCTELKLRKISRHLRRLNLNLRGMLDEDAVLQFDEVKTFEGRRNTRPLTVPVLIESDSRFIIWAESAPIRPRGKMTKRRLRAIAEEEQRFGPRRDRSGRAIARTLVRGAAMVASGVRPIMHTDEKLNYPHHLEQAFGVNGVEHVRTNSRIRRDTRNPLFPINHTEAMVRDLLGRLRRRSWLASKARRYLDHGLQLHAAYRNLVRKRFNHDGEAVSSAQVLGFLPRRLTPGEVLSWRQDWGGRSPFALGRRLQTAAECVGERRA